jgi:hypothetical protein
VARTDPLVLEITADQASAAGTAVDHNETTNKSRRDSLVRVNCPRIN